jgi:hypothetical protein
LKVETKHRLSLGVECGILGREIAWIEHELLRNRLLDIVAKETIIGQ